MQPEDEKRDFQQPADAPYFSASTTATSPESVPAEQPAAVETPTEQPVPPVAQADTEGSSDEQQQDAVESSDPNFQPVQWQSPEYHHGDRGILWFVGFGVVVIALVLVAIFIMQSWSFALLLLAAAAALIVYMRRPPQIIDYVLSEKGLYINDKLHGFAEFKAFGVIHDEHEYSISLIPVRRFQPSVSVYFPEEAGEQIVDILGVRLPMQELKPDAFDKIVRALRM